MSTCIRILFLLTLGLAGQAQARTLTGVNALPDRLELQTEEGRVQLIPRSNRIIETRFIPSGAAEPGPSHAVPPPRGAPVPTRLVQGKERLEYRTAGIWVQVQRAPLRISYHWGDRRLVTEAQGFHSAGDQQRLQFELDEGEALYGGGARALGMNRRGEKLPLYNRAHYGYHARSHQMSFGIPVVLSSKRYLIHFDDPGPGEIDLDSERLNRLSYSTISPRRSYQVVAGASWPELMAAYTELTGRQPLPPRWALGNFASRFGYRNAAQVRETVERYRAADIPLDAIVFDLYWFGKEVTGTMGNLAFDTDTFPDPKGLLAELNAQGVKPILITEPFVVTTSKRWQQAVDAGALATDGSGAPARYDFFFGNTGLIDVFKPEGRAWFWARYQELKALGVAGWWGDLGEPEVHPSWVQHASGSADQVHNIYGHAWAQLIAEGTQREYPDERPFILMRSGYSGSQRFGMIPWSGDVGRSWGGLQSQPEIALQMGLQGLGYMHSDLGGFARPVLDDELYTRWLQYGVFQPIFRPHAQEEVPSEPVYRTPETLALARQAIQLRYRMLPYNYTLAFENSQTGMPLMRPLWFAEPNRPFLAAHATSYFWGPDLLVSPVLSAGQTTQRIYFPAGQTFFDFYTGARQRGGLTRELPLRADRIPVYVRAGAFVPLAPEPRNTEQYDSRKLQLHYYHDDSVRQSRGELYDDDGKLANAHARGRYERLYFQSQRRADTLTLSIRSELGAQQAPQERQLDLQVHGLRRAPRQVHLGGRRLHCDWRRSEVRLQCPVFTAPGAQQRLTLKL